MQCEEMKKMFLNRPTGIKITSAVVVTGLVSYLRFRPIAILVSSVYVSWVYKTFYSHYTIQVPKELNQKCRQLYDNCKNLRESRPNVFCGFISSILFLLAIIGHIVNGTYILFACLVLAVLLTSTYEIKIVKDNIVNDQTPSGGFDVDEFVPNLDEANMSVLKRIGDHGEFSESSAKIASEESDSDNELLPSNTEIPEPDEIDNMKHDSEDFPTSEVLTKSAEYRRKHFGSSDSSDSDDSITRGLDFKNIPVVATIEPFSSTSSKFANPHESLSHNVKDQHLAKPGTQSSRNKPHDSDDDEISDFEFLDKDDLIR